MTGYKHKSFIIVTVLPAVLLTVFFMIIPTIRVFSTSFYKVTSLSISSVYVGLDNYLYMLKDNYFRLALRNTFFLMIVVPTITLTLSLLFAVILTQSQLKEKGFYRTVFFFPSILSMTVIAILWSFIYHPSMGIINSFLRAIGLGNLAKPWLGDAKFVLWAIAVTLIWQAAGYYMVMYIAGIDSIPLDIYEAATVDGAGFFRKLINITLPLLSGIIRITVVFALSGVINLSFVIVKIMTNGGPAGASSVLLQYMYTQAFNNSNFGYAMAIAVFTLIISFILSFFSVKFASRQE